VMVAPADWVLPPIPRVTVEPAIDATQLTPGLAIPVPETSIPTFKPVVLFSVMTFPPDKEDSVLFWFAAQALEVVNGPAADPVQAVADVAPAQINHFALPILCTDELKLKELSEAKASEIGSTTSGAIAASSANAILRFMSSTLQRICKPRLSVSRSCSALSFIHCPRDSRS